MRRRDCEIKTKEEIYQVFEKCDVIRVAFIDDNRPYVVPMNFGFMADENANAVIYFHCAKEGKKLDLIQRNKHVCIEADRTEKIETGERPCDWTCKYESIIGYGDIEIIEDENEKIAGMTSIMRHYGYQGAPSYDKGIFSRTVILKVTISEISGKKNF